MNRGRPRPRLPLGISGASQQLARQRHVRRRRQRRTEIEQVAGAGHEPSAIGELLQAPSRTDRNEQRHRATVCCHLQRPACFDLFEIPAGGLPQLPYANRLHVLHCSPWTSASPLHRTRCSLEQRSERASPFLPWTGPVSLQSPQRRWGACSSSVSREVRQPAVCVRWPAGHSAPVVVAIARSVRTRRLVFRRLGFVEAVVVNGVRQTVLHDNTGSVPAPGRMRRATPSNSDAVCVRGPRRLSSFSGLTYHSSITMCKMGARKCMILKTERCWSGGSGTLGNRCRPRVLTCTDTHQRTPHQRLPATAMCLAVSR
jgi:hypothetical protein